MAPNLDTLLIETLDHRAGGDIDPVRLMRTAVVRGRRIHRRRMLTGGTALAVVALLGVAVALPVARRDVAPGSAEAGAVITGRPPVLPAAAGQAGAADRPDLIGTDPRVLHFSVDELSGTASTVKWTSESGGERVEVLATDFEAHVGIGRTREMLGASIDFIPRAGGFTGPVAVRVSGRPGVLRSAVTSRSDGMTLWSLQWQPTEGFWAQADVWSRARGDVERVAERVRFDTAQRCALPFALTSIPTGMTVRLCDVKLSVDRGVRFFRGTLDVGDDRRQLDVQVSDAPTIEPFAGGLRAGPYRARRDDDLYTMAVPSYLVEAYIMTPNHPVTPTEVLQVLGGLRTRGTATDPASW